MNLDLLSERYKDEGFKEREVAKFETKFPGARIVKDKYTSERQLEEDWAGYCSLPYSLKVLCNERCLRLYGCKNEEQYLKLKSQFLKQDIPNTSLMKSVYRPMGFHESDNADPDFMNRQAQTYMDNGGFPLIRTDYGDMDELNKAYKKFYNQSHAHMKIANDKSKEFFGLSVPEVYGKEIKKFLVKDISDSNVEDPIKPVVNDSLTATEAVLESMAYTGENDVIEDILFTEIARLEADTPVTKTLVSMMEEKCIKANEAESGVNTSRPLGTAPIHYLLPWEVLNLSEDTESLMVDPLFVNYYAKAIGIKPRQGFNLEAKEFSDDEKKLFKIGWNPCVPFNEEIGKKCIERANRILSENIHYKFISFNHTPNMLSESEYNSEPLKGISVLVVKELDIFNQEKVDDVPKVLVSFEQDNPLWYTIIYGQLSYKQHIDSVIRQYSYPSVSLFFVHLDDDMYNSLQDNVRAFNSNNEIQRVSISLAKGAPHIQNKGLFVANLINSILYPQYGDNPFPLCLNAKDDGKKDMIHCLYNGLKPTWRDIRDAYSKLEVYREYEKELCESFFYKDANWKVSRNENIKPFDQSIFRESSSYNTWKEYKSIFEIPLQSLT